MKHEGCPLPESEHDDWCSWRENAQLRADLATVTAERDTALADWRFVTNEAAKNREEHLRLFEASESAALGLARELAETKAALEVSEKKEGYYHRALEASRAEAAAARELAEARGVSWQAAVDKLEAAQERIAELEDDDKQQRSLIDSGSEQIETLLSERDTLINAAENSETALAALRERVEKARLELRPMQGDCFVDKALEALRVQRGEGR